ncbi:restriction endonuclease, partial [Saliniramus sp.]|uniref:restriction endonuclease n=1 Tax=Saliniramus sp. TaxID=2986772 RepID=UPI002C540CBE
EQKLSAKEVDATDIVEPRTDTEIPQNEPEGEENWKSVLLERLGAIAPDAFERLAQRLLREAGFTKVEVRGKSGDGGIDGVGVLRVNLVSFQVYFQCKKWKGSVGAKEIRDFRGAMQGRADKGILITTGHFTSQASEEATRDGATAIDLIDGDRLCDLLKENRLGISTEMIERVNIDHEWFGKI